MKSDGDILNDAEATATLRDLFALLLKGHTELSRRIETEEYKESIEHRGQFSELIGRFGKARERDRHRQEDIAADFNLLEVLQLTHKEVRYSMVLAWLLDHDIDRLGTHAQGSLGLSLLLSELGLPARYAGCRYWVKREAPGDESIVDIEVAARGQFLIQIENKIWASEGKDQTLREWADLQRRATELGISIHQQYPPVYAFFLTPLGTQAMSRHFVPISWRRIVSVLTAFAEKAKPLDVKLFAAHYAKAIDHFIISQRQVDGEQHVETVIE